MKRMPVAIAIAVVGLAVCGFLVLRHARRTVLPARPDRPFDQWQGGIPLEARADHVTDAKARRLLEKLRQEERRQRPQEGRN